MAQEQRDSQPEWLCLRRKRFVCLGYRRQKCIRRARSG